MQRPAPRSTARPGGVLHLTIAITAGLAALAAAWLAGTAAPATSRRPRTEPTASELAVLLTRVALDPAALAAAGLTTQETAGLVADARAHANAQFDALRAADNSLASAAAEADRLERLVQSGRGAPTDPAALAAARAALTSARAARDAKLDALAAAATADLATVARSALSLHRAGRAWDVPAEFHAASRGEHDWLALRDALAAERTAAAWGDVLDPAPRDLLLAARADPAVAAASARLASNLASITAAWNQALQP